MGTVLLLAAMVAFLVGLVALIRPLPRLHLHNRKRAAGLMVVSVLVFAIAGGMLPEPSAVETAPAAVETAGPPALAKAHESIEGVAVERDEVVIRTRVAAVWTDTDYVPFTALTLTDIVRSIQAGAPEAEGANTVRLVVSAPGSDRLGNPLDLTLMNISFAASDLRTVKPANLSHARLMNLATRVGVSPAGREVVAKWCGKDDNLANAPSFCLSALD